MTDYSSGFQRWWTTYPPHRRREKPKCFEVWKKHKLEDRASEVIAKLEADVSFDPAWQRTNPKGQFIPLSKTYLNGGRYDDDKPKPPRTVPVIQEPERPGETDPYIASVKRVAVNWMIRRMRPLSKAKVEKSLQLIHTLAQDARELHKRGELTDGYAQVIRDELDALAAR